MQRSDISNINRLFLESANTYHVYVAKQTGQYNMFVPIRTHEISAKNLNEAISQIAVDMFNKRYIHVSKTQRLGAISTNSDDFVIVSSYEINTKYIHDTFLDTQVGAQFDRFKPSVFLSSYIRKRDALHDSDDEAGLGDVLDVL